MRVIGVGNILLCDEGIGVHVVRELSSRGETPGVEYVDGGVAGATLLNLVEGEERVVLVDAVDAPFPPGTVVRMTPDELIGSGAPAWSLHDLNLADTLGMMRLRETLPEMILLGVVPADIETYSLELSEPLAARFGEIVEKVRSEIAAFAASPRPMTGRPVGIAAIEITVRGVVQGVGFRPFVHRLASRCGLVGWVENTPGSVVIHVEGDAAALSRFRALFGPGIPPAARVTRLSVRKVAPAGVPGFTIRASRRDGIALSTIPPDIATCPGCLRELADPADRRHRYPFTNCTNCGPRFTIVTSLPYDRERTSMAAFPMCAACRKEYGDPLDRRFHAEPNACPACGPRLSVRDGDGAPVDADDPIGAVAAAILAGIDRRRSADSAASSSPSTRRTTTPCARCGERKRREEKPFAVMFRDVGSVRAAARIHAADEAILRSSRAPVLLAPARARSPLAPSVSAGLPTAGVFLPYTPLHRMLLDRADRPLVMTSGNATDEPIAIGNDEAMSRLRGIADLFLLHDREVVQRSDDSVVRRVGPGDLPDPPRARASSRPP